MAAFPCHRAPAARGKRAKAHVKKKRSSENGSGERVSALDCRLAAPPLKSCKARKRMLPGILARLVPPEAFEVAAREAAAVLQEAVESAFGDEAFVVPFGSLLQGSHLPDSDMDVCVHVPACEWDESRALRRLLSHLPSDLRVVEKRLSATIRVPIIILAYRSSTGQRIEMDVSVGTSQDGVEKGFTDRLMRRVLRRAPKVLSCVRMVKQWAKLKGLNKAFGGYLNSLGWTMLVVFYYIKRGDVSPHMMHEADEHELDDLPPPLKSLPCDAPSKKDLAGFFEMIAGFRSRYNAWGISLVEGGEINRPSEASPLFLEDPGARLVQGSRFNVARALRECSWKHILHECRDAAALLRTGPGSACVAALVSGASPAGQTPAKSQRLKKRKLTRSPDDTYRPQDARNVASPAKKRKGLKSEAVVNMDVSGAAAMLPWRSSTTSKTAVQSGDGWKWKR